MKTNIQDIKNILQVTETPLPIREAPKEGLGGKKRLIGLKIIERATKGAEKFET